MSNDFQKSWDMLSEAQKQAALLAVDNSVIVKAGPGSGKTRVLVNSIGHLLDTNPNEKFRILALTFTNKAANEMKQRIFKFFPSQKQRLFIGTFHSFCLDVLRQHGNHLGIKPNFQIYSQTQDLEEIFSEAIQNIGGDENDIRYLQVIRRLKSLLISSEGCCDEVAIQERYKEKLKNLYSEYERLLHEYNALDFESLLLETYTLFVRYPSFAKRYRAVYKYIFVDEFQDTNIAQYQLLRSLTGDRLSNVFAVADDDQIIYQWNGASHKRIDEFEKDFVPTVIQLPINYRCPPEIVEIANKLIQHNTLRSSDKQPYQSIHPKSEEDIVRLLSGYPTFQDEINAIAEDINSDQHRSPSNVVIIARNRRLLDQAKTVLQSNGIKSIIAQRKDSFESAPFLWLYSILQLSNERQNKKYLEGVCGSFAQLTNIQIPVEDVITNALADNNDYLRYWVTLLRNESPDESLTNTINYIEQYIVEGADYHKFCEHMLDWFEELNTAPINNNPSSDFFSNYEEEKQVWKALYREITHSFSGKTTLNVFLQEIQMRSKESEIGPDTLPLMTIHGSKGREFQHVYLVGMVEDELPSYQSKKKGDNSVEMEEERRNCFVAITRATTSLTLSYFATYKGWNKQPSRFLFEMGLLSNE